MLVQDPTLKGHSLKDLRQGDLLCAACSTRFEWPYIFRDRVVTHTKGKRHASNLERYHESIKRQKLVGELVGELNTGVDVRDSDKILRFETTRAFMIGGLPIKGVDAVRPVMERSTGASLTASAHLGECELTHQPY